jgi:hypothetical protein
MLNDFTRCHGTGCHQRHDCTRHTAPIPDNVLLSWAVNLNYEQTPLCAYFIADSTP